MEYSKQALSYEAQADRLLERGLQADREENSFVGYKQSATIGFPAISTHSEKRMPLDRRLIAFARTPTYKRSGIDTALTGD